MYNILHDSLTNFFHILKNGNGKPNELYISELFIKNMLLNNQAVDHLCCNRNLKSSNEVLAFCWLHLHEMLLNVSP